jgi:oxalate decarboxylase/phosphoglucose isomerase-like protein (cupin superfamily)
MHYHEKRESVISILSGKGLEIYGDEEMPIQAGDMILIPAGMKHAMVNTSDDELRFVEFYTLPPVQADFHHVG